MRGSADRPRLVPGEWVDPHGEVHSTPPIMVQPKRYWPEESVVVWQDAARNMAKMPDLGAEALRVWLYVVGSVGYENILAMSMSSLGRELGMQRQNVSRAVGKLVEADILIPEGQFQRSRTYRLNSNVGWRGSVKQLSKHRTSTAHREPKLKLVEGGRTDAAPIEDQRQHGPANPEFTIHDDPRQVPLIPPSDGS